MLPVSVLPQVEQMRCAMCINVKASTCEMIQFRAQITTLNGKEFV